MKTKTRRSNAPKLAIILPAYNEGPVINDVLAALPKFIAVKRISYKIVVIVVNDGSADNTAQVVSKYRRVHLINHVLNSGAGAATRTGLTYAKMLGCEYIVTADSDGQHATKDIVKVAKAVINDEADFILGSRLINSKGMPLHRVLGNKGLSFITFLIFGVFVTDSQSGLKGLNKTALDKITFHSNTYAFCSEMIWKGKQQHLRIKEIPIEAIYTEYSLAKGQSNWGALPIIRQIIKRRLLEFIDG